MKVLWLIVMVLALGLVGCERSRERKERKTTGTERPGTVAPAPEGAGTHERTTPPGETGTERETTPGEQPSERPGTESRTPGETGETPSGRTSGGATTAPGE